jgi:hypothetical protein
MGSLNSKSNSSSETSGPEISAGGGGSLAKETGHEITANSGDVSSDLAEFSFEISENFLGMEQPGPHTGRRFDFALLVALRGLRENETIIVR